MGFFVGLGLAQRGALAHGHDVDFVQRDAPRGLAGLQGGDLAVVEREQLEQFRLIAGGRAVGADLENFQGGCHELPCPFPG